MFWYFRKSCFEVIFDLFKSHVLKTFFHCFWSHFPLFWERCFEVIFHCFEVILVTIWRSPYGHASLYIHPCKVMYHTHVSLYILQGHVSCICIPGILQGHAPAYLHLSLFNISHVGLKIFKNFSATQCFPVCFNGFGCQGWKNCKVVKVLRRSGYQCWGAHGVDLNLDVWAAQHRSVYPD